MRGEAEAADPRRTGPVSALAGAALAHAACGWPVLPLRPCGKVPPVANAEDGNGVHDASSGPDRVKLPSFGAGASQQRDPSRRPGAVG
jgi:hypothetical protein